MTTVSALDPDLLTNEEAAALIGIKPNTLEIWRVRGKGPKFIKLGESKQAPIRYRRSDVLAWLEAQTCRSTSQYTARNQAAQLEAA